MADEVTVHCAMEGDAQSALTDLCKSTYAILAILDLSEKRVYIILGMTS